MGNVNTQKVHVKKDKEMFSKPAATVTELD